MNLYHVIIPQLIRRYRYGTIRNCFPFSSVYVSVWYLWSPLWYPDDIFCTHRCEQRHEITVVLLLYSTVMLPVGHDTVSYASSQAKYLRLLRLHQSKYLLQFFKISGKQWDMRRIRLRHRRTTAFFFYRKIFSMLMTVTYDYI